MTATAVPAPQHTGLVRQHVAQLSLLVRQHLLNYEFDRAAAVLVVLARRSTAIPEFVWKTAIQVMSQYPGQDTACLRIFRLFLGLTASKDSVERPTLVLELAFFLCKCGDFREAYSTLLGYLHTEPYHSSAVFHGYCGLFSYMIWEQELASQLNLAGALHVTQRSRSAHANAVTHFERSFTLDPSIVLFAVRYAQLLEYDSKYDLAEAALHRCFESNPENIDAVLNFYMFTTRRQPERYASRFQLLQIVLRLDATCPVLWDAVTLYEQNPTQRDFLKLALSVVTTRLDYPAHKDDILAWRTLVDLIPRYNSGCKPSKSIATTRLWIERQSWWPGLHFSRQRFESDSTVQDDRQRHLLLLKAVAALHLSGPACSYAQQALSVLEGYPGFDPSQQTLRQTLRVGIHEWETLPAAETQSGEEGAQADVPTETAFQSDGTSVASSWQPSSDDETEFPLPTSAHTQHASTDAHNEGSASAPIADDSSTHDATESAAALAPEYDQHGADHNPTTVKRRRPRLDLSRAASSSARGGLSNAFVQSLRASFGVHPNVGSRAQRKARGRAKKYP
ncbi:hypothetical protein CAOG_01426 [Capsaspora owczarzaki ATCC 30864]|uniref:Uncharacterized protein n=1 Tax=Capsaspora owczarzaki (strain ATCC 30864) TaxID=595528 RepID=A0A0D2WJ78_CAPO3|nr:hypothetical protein CAOG_01426 [Capsaspora owczarzaki ATCC 30864]KJE90050.1 hypothetical protein CAOG_001426 [Capsaspora owczarzaki ATCC 30864]|eukprot:XP_004349946.1 hypothetical protein CAOG_01426 [Capsaspora owczarzaki ATCC 30864]